MTLPDPTLGQAAAPAPGESDTQPPDIRPGETGEQGTEQKPKKEEPTFVTREELAARDAQLIEMLEKRDQALLYRAGKSATARARNEIAAYRATLEAQKAAGIETTPAQQAAVEDQIIKRSILTEDAAPSSPGQQSAPPAPDAAAYGEELLAKQAAVFLGAGTAVVPGDPEFAAIQAEWDDPRGSEEKFLAASADAAKKKADRLAQEKQTARARTPGGGTGASAKPNPIANINDPDKLYKMAEDEVRSGAGRRS